MKSAFIYCIIIPAAIIFCEKRDHLKEMVVEKAWLRVADKGQVSAGYFTIQNFTTKPDFLTGAEGDIAGTFELHRVKIDKMIRRMYPVTEIKIPAGSQKTVAPGGDFHLMIIGLKRDLRAGEKVKLRLVFKNSGAKNVEFRVVKRGWKSPYPVDQRNRA